VLLVPEVSNRVRNVVRSTACCPLVSEVEICNFVHPKYEISLEFVLFVGLQHPNRMSPLKLTYERHFNIKVQEVPTITLDWWLTSGRKANFSSPHGD